MLFLVSGKLFDTTQTLLIYLFLIIGASFAFYGLYMFFRDKKKSKPIQTTSNYSKKSMLIAFGGFCIILGLTSDSSNSIPAIYKYLSGTIFIIVGVFFTHNEKDKTK
tara:strand:- start:246 stop:566 length:321 start_codon:yes stop_codon:yes gene_type:complete